MASKRYSTTQIFSPYRDLTSFRDITPPSDDELSFDLLSSSPSRPTSASLEELSPDIFGAQHLSQILCTPTHLSNFADFLNRRQSETDGLKTLVYYLDATKALNALAYSNAIASGLEGWNGADSQNAALEKLRDNAFDGLLEEMSAWVTERMVGVVSQTVRRQVINGGIESEDDGLGECFCLTDPSRADNPIVFMSEEFNRITQYGVKYAIGKNCRFLQGPKTDRRAIRRLKEAVEEKKETSEVFLNYRRDGSPFFNLLMMAPLFDSQGKLRYYIGAQVDITPLVTNIDTFRDIEPELTEDPDVFRSLTELFNDAEIETTRLFSGRLHRGQPLKRAPATRRPRARVVLNSEPPMEAPKLSTFTLKGVYENYLLLRPYPSLRILFTSPSLRTPGIHQRHFLDKIGGLERTRSELHQSLRNGSSVTAKVVWITNRESEDGRERWVHCTPLLDATGAVGVWMVIVVDPIVQRPMEVVDRYSPPETNEDDFDDCTLKVPLMPTAPPSPVSMESSPVSNRVFMEPSPVPTRPNRLSMEPSPVLTRPNRVSLEPSPIPTRPSRISIEPGSISMRSRSMTTTLEDEDELDASREFLKWLPGRSKSTSGFREKEKLKADEGGKKKDKSGVDAFARELGLVAAN